MNSKNPNDSSVLVSNLTDYDSEDENIVSCEIRFNHQAGSGHYREIRYKDGGFRQFDVDTGKLIGSSYESDQKYLPCLRILCNQISPFPFCLS